MWKVDDIYQYPLVPKLGLGTRDIRRIVSNF